MILEEAPGLDGAVARIPAGRPGPGSQRRSRRFRPRIDGTARPDWWVRWTASSGRCWPSWRGRPPRRWRCPPGRADRGFPAGIILRRRRGGRGRRGVGRAGRLPPEAAGLGAPKSPDGRRGAGDGPSPAQAGRRAIGPGAEGRIAFDRPGDDDRGNRVALGLASQDGAPVPRDGDERGLVLGFGPHGPAAAEGEKCRRPEKSEVSSSS
jgi:hypothetical protein